MTVQYSIPKPQSPFVDPSTGLVAREWYLFLNNVFGTIQPGAVTVSSGALSTNQLVIADGPSDIASLTGLTASSMVFATSSGAIGTPAALLNGQLFIGSTGALPVASTLTASTGIAITNSAGSIAIAVSNPLSSKIVRTTRDLTTASGNQAVTGVGFRPTSIVFFAERTGQPEASHGFTDSASTGSCIFMDGLAGAWNQSSSVPIVMTDPVAGSNTAALNSYDADGYTLAWTKVGVPVGTSTIFSLCYR